MKLSCNVIRDLLPLYAEKSDQRREQRPRGRASVRVRRMREAAGDTEKAQAIPVETDAPGLKKKIRKAIVRRRVLAVTMAVMLVITLVLGATFLWEAPVWLTQIRR